MAVSDENLLALRFHNDGPDEGTVLLASAALRRTPCRFVARDELQVFYYPPYPIECKEMAKDRQQSDRPVRSLPRLLFC